MAPDILTTKNFLLDNINNARQSLNSNIYEFSYDIKRDLSNSIHKEYLAEVIQTLADLDWVTISLINDTVSIVKYNINNLNKIKSNLNVILEKEALKASFVNAETNFDLTDKWYKIFLWKPHSYKYYLDTDYMYSILKRLKADGLIHSDGVMADGKGTEFHDKNANYEIVHKFKITNKKAILTEIDNF